MAEECFNPACVTIKKQRDTIVREFARLYPGNGYLSDWEALAEYVHSIIHPGRGCPVKRTCPPLSDEDPDRRAVLRSLID